MLDVIIFLDLTQDGSNCHNQDDMKHFRPLGISEVNLYLPLESLVGG